MRVFILVVALLTLARQAHGSTHLRRSQEHEPASQRNQAVDTDTHEDGSYWERLLQNTASSTPVGPPTPPVDGDGSIGDDCFDNEDCKELSCFEDPPSPSGIGRCTCNPDLEESGCEGGFFCATPDEIGIAVGALISVAPSCKLPVGVPCDVNEPNDCLTAVCSDVTNLCACNPNNNWPCDTDAGEFCLFGDTDGFVCSPLDGDGSVGDSCFSDDDCQQQSCVEDPPLPSGIGRCSCNPDLDETGCDGDSFCATPLDIVTAVGEVINVSPFCKLPVEAPCDATEPFTDCITEVCNEATGLCGCNTNTNFPCDIDNGELCLDGANGLECSNPGTSDGDIGSICESDSDCNSGVCFNGFLPPETPRECVCNPDTNAGCAEGLECFGTPQLADIQGIADLPNDCYLPVDAACDGRSAISASCVTGTCDAASSRCAACNDFTNWPCTEGELCFVGESGSLACGSANVEPLSNNTSCPEPDPNIACTDEYDPVECDGCVYPNQCVATAANFTTEVCTSQVCPSPSADVACTKENKPVVCGNDCEYSNQCLATSADPNFTNTTCISKSDLSPNGDCPKFDGICTLEYAPVNCSGCEYTNQCFATGANANYTDETCTPVCPTFDGICTLEEAPVNCSGCECLATGANPAYTNETCTPVNP